MRVYNNFHYFLIIILYNVHLHSHTPTHTHTINQGGGSLLFLVEYVRFVPDKCVQGVQYTHRGNKNMSRILHSALLIKSRLHFCVYARMSVRKRRRRPIPIARIFFGGKNIDFEGNQTIFFFRPITRSDGVVHSKFSSAQKFVLVQTPRAVPHLMSEKLRARCT